MRTASRRVALQPERKLVFKIIAVPFDAFQDLPPLEFKVMAAALRYVNRAGECWPTLRQLAADVRKSEATVCRVMQRLAGQYGAFTERKRAGNGRYHYRIAARFLPRWPGKRQPEARLAAVQDGLAHAASQEANPIKQDSKARERARYAWQSGKQEGLPPDPADQWRMRIRSWLESRFWLPAWGDTPDRPGCMAPARIIKEVMGQNRP
jgi:hypothetical protein